MKWLQSFWKRQALPRGEIPGFVESRDNFTPRAQQVLSLARKEASRLNHRFIGTEHLLLGLIKLGQGTAVAVFNRMGVELEMISIEVEKQVGAGPDETVLVKVPYTPRVKKVLSLAAQEAKELNHTYVGTEHILLGLLKEDDGIAARALKNVGLELDAVRQNLLKELNPDTPSLIDNSAILQKMKPLSDSMTRIDLSKRYDIYCRHGSHETVYRNALFRGVKTLFQKTECDVFSEYIEVEEADGTVVFVARSTVIKFVEHKNP